MSQSPRLGLSYILPQQAQKHVSANESFRRLDALVQLTVISASVAAEPPAPADGDIYILPATPVGTYWSAMSPGSLAAYQDAQWFEYPPSAGWRAFDKSAGRLLTFDGGQWIAAAATGESSSIFGVNTMADAVNRLSVKSDVVLFSHDDLTPGSGNARQIINKAATANTASILMQSGYAGRAEIGLAGDNDLRFKVSSDGVNFHEGMKIRNSDGKASFPAGLAAPLDLSSGGTGATSGISALGAFGLRYSLGTINDDSVALLNLGAEVYGAAILAVSNALTSGPTAFFYARMATNPAISTLFSGGASFSIGTGALAGSTGADGQTNFSVDAGGKFYVENRRGYAVSYTLYLFR